MRKKVITLALGQMVLDNVIHDRQGTPLIKDQNNLFLGGPPSFAGIIGLILSKMFPWMAPPLVYAYGCPKAVSLLKKLPDYDLVSKNLMIQSKCPQFRLEYSSDENERMLSLRNPPLRFNLADFNWKFVNPPVAIVSSVYHEFSNYKIFSSLRNRCSYIAFDPQGCFRQLTATGKIKLRKWWDSEIMKNIDCIKVSETEAKFLKLGTHPVKIVTRILKTPVTSVLLTRGKNGAILGVKNPNIHIYDVPAFTKGTIVDETGAGDVFLFTFVTHFQTFANELDAIAFATSVTSLFLEQERFMVSFTEETISSRQDKIRSKIIEFLK
ncbi:MAG: hypothetical protein JSU57_06575 [Candidatus Heimdallarchaeota archaeon]|nr:MAG: hypothetical protein JSU57_06575 [Candidatus Heimdallarchaeota archaeon]